MFASKDKFFLCFVVCLLMVANGVPFASAAILFVILAAIGSFYARTEPMITVGLLTIKVALTLAIFALGWVMVVSYDTWWRWVVVPALLTFAPRMISRFTDSAKVSHGTDNANYPVLLLSSTAIVLVLRSWIHFFPMLIALGICSALPRLTRARRSPVLVNATAVVVASVGALGSRLLLSGADVRIWMTYDQQFRASLATGLTRWGWTDWNAAPGQEIRYHWLSEATAGFLSRIAMMDEFDAVTRVMPVLGIVAIVLVAVHTLRELGLTTTVALIITIPVVGLHSALEVFSIGTMWGGLWILVTTYLLYISWNPVVSHTHLPAREWVTITAIGVALLTQSTAGITLGIVTGFVYLHQVVTGRRRLGTVLLAGIALSVLVLLASQTILQSRGGTAYGADLRNFVKEGWRFFPADIAIVFVLIVLRYRNRIATRDLLLPAVYVLTAMVISNVVRIGGHEGRLLSEARLVVTVFGLGVIARCASTLNVRRHGRGEIVKSLGTSAVALSIVGCVAYMSYSYAEGVQRNWGFSTRTVFPLERVHGDRDIDACLDWIRSGTPPDALVASNMWRTPGSEDQKYFLVSLKTKRHVLVDGPTYVANTGTYDDPAVLEGYKNLIDYFTWSPTLARMQSLKDLGVDVLLVDETRKHSPRIGNFVASTVSNPRCSVYTL